MRFCLPVCLVCLLLLFPALPVAAIGLPAGTTFQLVAEGTFSDIQGNLYTADPAWVTLTVRQVAGVSVEGAGQPGEANPGQDFYIPIRIVNIGNGFDAFTLSAASSRGWSVAVVYDDNGDGVHQPDEQWVITTAGLMVADGYSPCFARVTVPQGATSGDALTVAAVSSYDPAGSNQAQFIFDVKTTPSAAITIPTANPTFTVTSPSIDIGGTASGGLSIAQVEWATDHGAGGTCSGTSSWTAAGIGLQLGSNVITITATDTSGRTGTDTCTVTYNDATPPTVAITSPVTGAAYTTDNPQLAIAGTAADEVAVAAVSWSNDRGGSGACTGTTSWSASGVALSAGQNVITVTASDAAGNKGTAVLTVTCEPPDATAPTASISSPTSAATYTATSASIEMAGAASDNVGVSSVTWSSDRGRSGTCAGATSWSASGIALSAGQNVITVTASDAAGNKGAAVLTVTYEPPDATAPTASISSPTSAATFTAASASIDMAGSASDNVAVTSVTWSNDRGGSGACAGTTSWSASGIAVSAGQNVITVTASDAAGNKGTRLLTVTYSPDVTKPTIAIDTPTDQGQCARNCPVVTIGGIASDNSAVAGVTWSNAATGESGACALNGAAWSAAGIGLAAGDNAITAAATDDSGNTATDTVTVTWVNAAPGAAWTGMAMVSLPIIPDQIDPKLETGFYEDYWCAFLTNSNMYAVYPDKSTWLDPADSTPGRGFWTYFDSQAATPYGTIPPQNQPAAIHLTTGWNLVGTPFVSEVAWDISELTVKGPDGSVRALRNAPDLTPGYAWGWRQDPNDPSTGAYYLVYDSSIVPGVDDKMEPWRAYWILAIKDCDLIIPPP